VLNQVNGLESKHVLDGDEANRVRGSMMVAFKDIDSIEVYAASKKHL
jgi:hypothetical protein